MTGHKLDKKVKHKSDDSITNIHDYDVDVKANHIYLTGNPDYIISADDTSEPGVEYTMSSKFIKNMNILMRTNPDQPIVIHMKTCGGDWSEGMAIHNMIKSCPVPVTILSYTHARSMSSIIFQAANKRVMMPDSYFMIHDGTYGIEGTVKQVNSSITFDNKSENRMLDIYAESLVRNGKFKGADRKRIKKHLRHLMDKKEDVFFTAKEALEYGFCDEIFGETMNFDWSKLTEYTDEQLRRG